MSAKPVNDATFQGEVLDEKEQYVLVDFWAEWCGPCKMLGPVIDSMSKTFEGKIKVMKLDVDANPNAAQTYAITSIPCNILFKDGQEVDRIVGHLPAPAFESKLNSLISG